MAIDDIALLSKELPELFQMMPLPSGWPEDWYYVSIETLESLEHLDQLLIELLKSEGEAVNRVSPLDRFNDYQEIADFPNVKFDNQSTHPGSPVVSWHSPMPPPDAWAFYLPFHYYFPTWWGIYVTVEGAYTFARLLIYLSNNRVDAPTALYASKVFLYYHEAFHHNVESFSAKIEVTHRIPLYRTGFQALFDRVCGTDDCLEEALASAYGIQKLKERISILHPEQWPDVQSAIGAYLKECPPGYRRAMDYIHTSKFSKARAAFAEDNLIEALPPTPRKDPGIWDVFNHSFAGIGRVTSRINYIVHADSPLSLRLGLRLRYLRYRDLIRKLEKLAGATFVRRGGIMIYTDPQMGPPSLFLTIPET